MSKIKSTFRIPYDNSDEVRLRLQGTVIRWKGKVHQVVDHESLPDGGFRLHLQDYDGRVSLAVYPEDPDIDLSPLPPIYTHFGEVWEGRAYLVSRQAVRRYQQGATSQNTRYVEVGNTHRGGPCSMRNLLQAYTYPVESVEIHRAMKTVAARANGLRLFKSMALSPYVALFREYDDLRGIYNEEYNVEYLGTHLGVLSLRDGDYFLKTDNESLSLNPWCLERLNAVGIFLE